MLLLERLEILQDLLLFRSGLERKQLIESGRRRLVGAVSIAWRAQGACKDDHLGRAGREIVWEADGNFPVWLFRDGNLKLMGVHDMLL